MKYSTASIKVVSLMRLGYQGRFENAGTEQLQIHHLDFVYQPLRDLRGDVTGILVQGVDLTERSRAKASADATHRTVRCISPLVRNRVVEYSRFGLCL